MTLIDSLASLTVAHFTAFGAAMFLALAASQVRRRNRHSEHARRLLDQAVQSQQDEPFTLHPEIDPALCAGCGACTTACPEGDILKLLDHKAVLVSPTRCVGHGECEAACPTEAITLVFGTKRRGMDLPRITGHYETNVPGLYIAGELGGMGLIRNAVRQGHLAARHALENVRRDSLQAPAGAPLDAELLIVGAGPAGLAAGLTAIAEKRSYICIEQNSFGGTVYNFPRQKIVMTHQAELPILGRMKLKGDKVSKEDLLAIWNDAREKTGLKVREHVRFESLSKDGDVFTVETTAGPLRAAKVILCTGVRGSPRRLGLRNEDTPKVAYSLIDPEQYHGQHIAIVGSGNSAAEAVQMLCDPRLANKVTMLIRGADFDRCHEENKRKVLELERAGRVRVLYETSVSAIAPDQLMLARPGGASESLLNHFLFIFAGTEMPSKFLLGLGVEIERKFGVPLRGKSGKKERG